MQNLPVWLIYLMFFLSGAAALIYEVVWVRSLSLVFGGSHLAVTTVLTIFMGGLALGSYLIGKRISNRTNLLRIYGLLELGIALAALVFALLLRFYPSIYVTLAQLAVTSTLYLSFIRVMFAIIALIVPTTLMGGTLPVLSSFVATRAKTAGAHLSFLYGLNTLGAVVGAAAAGFVLLRYFSVSTTMFIAILINLSIGMLSIFMQNKIMMLPAETVPGGNVGTVVTQDAEPAKDSKFQTSCRLVL